MNPAFLYDLHTQTTCSSMVLGVIAWVCFSACTYFHAWLKALGISASGPKAPPKPVA